ncbi:MAG: glycosyltransferase family 2 protein, partial [Bacteroidia bacterium]|nr:glycosyltransferase family 2 protein [Bacteroidia bacterium]
MEISIVIPVYRAELIVDELVSRLCASLNSITSQYEIILVDDCGPDKSWDKIVANAANNNKIIGIRLSRNFGQHHAITAGLDKSTGNWVVVMDCDLQDQPEEIAKLYAKAKEGYDIVFARRAQRQDTFIKRFTSQLFYKGFAYLSGIPQDGTIGNFGIYNRKVIDAINAMREPMRAFAPMARWVGFNRTAIDVAHAERFEGSSSYNWSRLITLALDIAMAYSDKPLKLTVKLGIGISFLSVLYTLYNIVLYNMGIIKLSGYTSLIVSIWFLSGLTIFTLGILGLYLGKVFEGIK